MENIVVVVPRPPYASDLTHCGITLFYRQPHSPFPPPPAMFILLKNTTKTKVSEHLIDTLEDIQMVSLTALNSYEEKASAVLLSRK